MKISVYLVPDRHPYRGSEERVVVGGGMSILLKGDFMKAMPLPRRPQAVGERLFVPARGVDLNLEDLCHIALL